MGDFANGVNILSRPIPGRPIKSEVIKESKIEQKDINAIADAVIKAISSKMPTIGAQNIKEDFDDSASLDKLAKAMIIGRDGKDSNLEGMGTIRETKKDEKETKNTIDMLSKLSD